MPLPASSEDTLHFYRYLCAHVLVTDKQFLLLSNVPIEDPVQPLEIYEVFNLVIPHRNFSAHYNIDNKYLGITYDETKAVEISEQQFSTCQKANREFCSINTPLQPLANPPSCMTATYAKNKVGIEKRYSLQMRNDNSATIPTPIASNVWILASEPTVTLTEIMIICPEEAPRFIKTQTPIHILCLSPACSAAFQHFHLPPPATDESIDDTASIWTLFSHTGIYIMAIRSLIPAGLGIFCCYFFWCQPARLVH